MFINKNIYHEKNRYFRLLIFSCIGVVTLFFPCLRLGLFLKLHQKINKPLLKNLTNEYQ